jgi:hypothetical protein
MANINIITEVENAIIEELKTLFSDVKGRLKIGKNSGVRFVGSNSLKASADKPSVNVVCLSGDIEMTAMSKYSIVLDIYITVTSTVDTTGEDKSRAILYPVLTAILMHLSGRRVFLKKDAPDTFTLVPKQPFGQRDNNPPFLEYICSFTTKFILDGFDCGNPLQGVIAKYFADPQNMPYEPADLGSVITNGAAGK